MSEHLAFRPWGKSASGKTRTWKVERSDGQAELGAVGWWAPWRKYVFFPHDLTTYDANCLRSIANFCEKATTDHKAARAALREAGDDDA